MFCNNCGKELRDGAKFCSGCGTTIEADEQQAPPAQQYQQPVQEQQAPQYAPPPPEYQQQPQYAPPPVQVQQPYYDPAQQAPPPQGKKKSKGPIFGIAGAAAGVLVFFLVIFPMLGGSDTKPKDGGKSGGLNVESYTDRKSTRLNSSH